MEKNKSHILCIIVILFLGVILGACSGKDDSNKGKISVVSTIFAPYDFARQIVGDNAEVTMLLPPGSESHSYEPSPKDIITIQECDVFIYVGGESDEWVRTVLESIDTSNIKIITLMDCVEIVEEEIVEGMEEDDEGNQQKEYDEHVWTSPKNAKLIANKILDAICAIDSEKTESYKKNAESYITKLDELDKTFKEVVDSGVRKTLIFGDRFPFRYLTDAYGLDYYAAFPGCSSETEASAATVAFLISKTKSEKIPVVFHIEFSSEKIADVISEATGANVLLFHSCHNITKTDFENGVTYIDLMNQNVKNLREALK